MHPSHRCCSMVGVETEVLRWFQQVADGVTVTEVSDLEAVTQSGVSRALARLEAEVGTPLLRRSGRTLRLTQAGAVVPPRTARARPPLPPRTAPPPRRDRTRPRARRPRLSP